MRKLLDYKLLYLILFLLFYSTTSIFITGSIPELFKVNQTLELLKEYYNSINDISNYTTTSKMFLYMEILKEQLPLLLYFTLLTFLLIVTSTKSFYNYFNSSFLFEKNKIKMRFTIIYCLTLLNLLLITIYYLDYNIFENKVEIFKIIVIITLIFVVLYFILNRLLREKLFNKIIITIIILLISSYSYLVYKTVEKYQNAINYEIPKQISINSNYEIDICKIKHNRIECNPFLNYYMDYSADSLYRNYILSEIKLKFNPNSDFKDIITNSNGIEVEYNNKVLEIERQFLTIENDTLTIDIKNGLLEKFYDYGFSELEINLKEINEYEIILVKK